MLGVKLADSIQRPHFGDSRQYYAHVTFSPSHLQPESPQGGRGPCSPDIPAQCKSPFIQSLPGLPQTQTNLQTEALPAHLPSFLLSFTHFSLSCSSPLHPSQAFTQYFLALLLHLGIFFPKDPSRHHQYYRTRHLTVDEAWLPARK